MEGGQVRRKSKADCSHRQLISQEGAFGGDRHLLRRLAEMIEGHEVRRCGYIFPFPPPPLPLTLHTG